MLFGCKQSNANTKTRVASNPVIFLALLWFGSNAAYAEDLALPDFSVSGFGTLGAVHSSQDNADFVGNFYQPEGAGHSKSWATSVDSKLGVQLDMRFTEDLVAVVQAVSQYDKDGRYTPEVEWAYVDYKLTPDLSLRIGRMMAPTFMESETRLVGYTYPWIRPPQEVYGVNPMTNKDAVEIRYSFFIKQLFSTIQASYGSTSKDFAGGSGSDADDLVDVQYIGEYADTSFRMGYMSMKVSVDSPALDAFMDAFESFGNNAGGLAGERALFIADRFRNEPTEYTIASLGVNHSPGDWLFKSEWVRSDIEHPTSGSESVAGYLTIGYRMGEFTPYVSVARRKLVADSRATIPLDGLSLEQFQFASALNAGFNASVGGFLYSQKRFFAGLRWDVLPNLDVKFQFEHLRTADSGAGSSGFLKNAQADFRPGDIANVSGIAMDFVF